MRNPRYLALAFVLLPALGFTDCSYFTTTTVPSTDSTRPLLATRMWIGGVESVGWNGTYEYLTDRDDANSIFIAPAIYDFSGVASLTLQQEVHVYCYADGLGQISIVDFWPQTTSQSGHPGSVVSNGMYLIGDVNSLTEWEDLCHEGFDLVSVTYGWSMQGRDFNGNTAEPYVGEIVWEP